MHLALGREGRLDKVQPTDRRPGNGFQIFLGLSGLVQHNAVRFKQMKTAIVLPFFLAPFLALGAGKQLSGPYAPTASPALPPAQAQKAFKLPPGFEARLFAAEPDVVNPV